MRNEEKQEKKIRVEERCYIGRVVERLWRPEAFGNGGSAGPDLRI